MGIGFRRFTGFRRFRRFTGFRGLWIALAGNKFVMPPLAATLPISSENQTTSLRSWKCTPIGAAHHFPRRGKSALRPVSELISITRHSTARISPSGGDAAEGGKRSAFPTPAGRWACFPSPARAVVWFCHTGAPSFPKGAHHPSIPIFDPRSLVFPATSY